MSRLIDSTYLKPFIGKISGASLVTTDKTYPLKGDGWRKFNDGVERSYIAAEAPNWGPFSFPWLPLCLYISGEADS